MSNLQPFVVFNDSCIQTLPRLPAKFQVIETTLLGGKYSDLSLAQEFISFLLLSFMTS